MDKTPLKKILLIILAALLALITGATGISILNETVSTKIDEHTQKENPKPVNQEPNPLFQ